MKLYTYPFTRNLVRSDIHWLLHTEYSGIRCLSTSGRGKWTITYYFDITNALRIHYERNDDP